MQIINGFDRLFTYFIGAACVMLFAVMIASVFGQVIMRYVFDSPMSWSEELARYAMAWQAMLAAALCMQRRLHLALFPVEALPDRFRAIAHVIGIAAIAVLLAVLFWHSWDLASRSGRQTTPGLGLSMMWVYASLPIGFGLMLVGLALSVVSRPDDLGKPGTPIDHPLSDTPS